MSVPQRKRPSAQSWRLLCLTVVVLIACGDRHGLPEADGRGRVFLIGIDGASPLVVSALVEQGRLPTLAAIARGGASGRILSARPIFSPRIWTTIATGKVPARHGIENFRVRDADGSQRLHTSADRRVHALWNIASSRGLRVGVVNWWVTHPAEKLNGVMVSDHLIPALLPKGGLEAAPEEGLENAVFPPSSRRRFFEAVRAPEIPVPFDDFLIDDETLPRWVKRDALSRHLHADAAAARCALVLEAEESPDILMVFLPGIDRVSHWLWGSREPAELYPERLHPTPAERQAGVAALHRYYEYVDGLIGRLIETADSDDLVVVVSDHGFEGGTVPFRPNLTGLHASEKALHGVLFARGPGIAPGSGAEDITIRDVTPTILAWLGLPIALDMDGRVAALLLRENAAAPLPVATYEGEPIERLDGAGEADGVVLDQLRELGYIE